MLVFCYHFVSLFLWFPSPDNQHCTFNSHICHEEKLRTYPRLWMTGKPDYTYSMSTGFLVLATIKLLFYVEAHIVPWFGFVMKIVLKHTVVLVVARQCLYGQGLFFFSCCSARLKLKGDTARTADSTWLKGYFIPYDSMLSKHVGKKGGVKGHDIWRDGICISKYVHVMEPCFIGDGWTSAY